VIQPPLQRLNAGYDVTHIGNFCMSKMLAGLGGIRGAFVAGGGMVVAIALGAYLGFGREGDVTKTALSPSTPNEVAPQKTVAAQQEQSDATVAKVLNSPELPQFDELRRETDGTTIIAGRAEPRSEVAIIVDGAQVATTTADSNGGFAAITVLPPKDTAQVIGLSSQGDDGEGGVRVSLDEIILAPTANAVTQPEPVESETSQQVTTAAEPLAAEATTEVEAVENDPQPDALAAPQTQPAEVAVLRSDAEGVRLLNLPQPEAMTSVALDTIGYSDGGDVQLAGRAQPDTARVRVYLNNQSVISLPVDADGRWRGDLPDVDEGIYTLRVDEVSNAGDVSSRVETPFKRESVEVLAQAAKTDGPVKSVTVQAGATLWAIARERYGDGTLYLRVVEANASSIRDPDLIYPGQVFDLPN
jgi:nucleoid-associated protein YgaU